jgi:hypothetical protein
MFHEYKAGLLKTMLWRWIFRISIYWWFQYLRMIKTPCNKRYRQLKRISYEDLFSKHSWGINAQHRMWRVHWDEGKLNLFNYPPNWKHLYTLLNRS